MAEPKTHFGYELIPEQEKEKKVTEVFDSVASHYDLMNDLMSFGIHRLWKKFTIDQVNAKPGQHILDLAGGTGDLALAFAKQVGSNGEVILADINLTMLKKGRE